MSKIEFYEVVKRNTFNEVEDFRPKVFNKLEDGTISVETYYPIQRSEHVEDYSIGSLLDAGIQPSESSIGTTISTESAMNEIESINIDKLNFTNSEEK